jgi:hypothetical protein
MAAKQLKGVILSVVDTILNTGQVKADVFAEVEKLMAFFTLRGVKPVLLANLGRTITDKDGNKKIYTMYSKVTSKTLLSLLVSVTVQFHQNLAPQQLSMSWIKWAGSLTKLSISVVVTMICVLL